MSADEEQGEPLLSPETSSTYGSVDDPGFVANPTALRAVENDVIPETATYGRNLSWSSAYIMVISRVIGSGIFAMPGTVFKTAGSVGLSLLLWIFGAFVAWCGLAVSLEYGCMLPRSGGDKVYLEYTYRRPKFLASTLVAASAVLLGFTASNCIIFGKYVLFAFDIEPTDAAQKLLAVGLLTAITIVHGGFLKTGIFIQNALGWAKVVLFIFMFTTGLFVVTFRPYGSDSSPRVNLFNWDQLWSGSEWNWGVVSTAIFKVSYSYAGLANVNNVLNEVKDPVRTLKSVTRTALITSCILYLLMNVAYFAVVPLEEIRQSGELVAALFCERVFATGFGKTFLPLAIAISAAGNVMVVTFALVSSSLDLASFWEGILADESPLRQARVNQEVARQGFLPYASLFSSSRPFNAPLGGLIVHYVPSLLVIILPPSNDVYAFIADVELYPSQFYALAVAVGLLWLRYKRPDLNRPFKAWKSVVGIRIAICLALIAAPFFPPQDGQGDVSFFYATYALVGIGM
ncbi:MAG: hypothetical protein M1837_003735 [Sclerophora amabilis]|nr:MAG: hypothetical protein M1837_003735 [Sclerophora amabilis]